jgi:hypothetical protein
VDGNFIGTIYKIDERIKEFVDVVYAVCAAMGGVVDHTSD